MSVCNGPTNQSVRCSPAKFQEHVDTQCSCGLAHMVRARPCISLLCSYIWLLVCVVQCPSPDHPYDDGDTGTKNCTSKRTQYAKAVLTKMSEFWDSELQDSKAVASSPPRISLIFCPTCQKEDERPQKIPAWSNEARSVAGWHSEE